MNITQRICDLSKKPITSTDKMSVQLTYVDLDENGKATDLKVLNICGAMRREGKTDGLVTELFLS